MKILRKFSSFAHAAKVAVKSGAYGDFFEFMIYRSPLGLWWARNVRGHRFHRSAFVWFHDDGLVHSRASMLLPAIKRLHPQLETLDMDIEFYSENGTRLALWQPKNVSVRELFVIDSKNLPPELQIPKPFKGALLIKQHMNEVDDKTAVRVDGLFSSTFTYMDYYKEGSFITTTHDYSQFLPDQGINYGVCGMIPAYCDQKNETFLLIHAGQSGLGSRDLEARLHGAGEAAIFGKIPAIEPFGTRKIFLSELFPQAGAFLNGALGQVVLEGNFRQIMKRIAYGVQDKLSGTFSFDHAFFSVYEKKPRLTTEDRERYPKGWFSPFLVLEDETHSTSAIIYNHAKENESKDLDVLIYDLEGNKVAEALSYSKLGGTQVKRIEMAQILKEHGVALPFQGHAELIYHKDPSYLEYNRDLDHCVEYVTKGRIANIVYGNELWNGNKPVINRKYGSANRIVCNDSQTTYLAISNCSHYYDYQVSVDFMLNLIVDGKTVAKKQFSLAPHATLFEPIEYFFPNARELMAIQHGVAYTVTSDINCAYLTHQFMTQDRLSGALAVEHSLPVHFYSEVQHV